jgi:Protein phosphatase 2C
MKIPLPWGSRPSVPDPTGTGRHAASTERPETRPTADNAAPEIPPACAAAHGPWAPIVVDRPVAEFEPRPPALRPYRPDTVCDGWSAGQMTIRLASVRGYSHRYSGRPRQDDADLAYEPRSQAVVFAIADGVSAASHSHIGAALACQVAVDLIGRDLAAGHAGPDWEQMIRAAAAALTRRAAGVLGQRTATREEAARLLATTLTAGYLLPAPGGLSGSVLQIGDSGAWILRRGQYQPLLEVKTTAYVTSSAVSALPQLPAAVTPVRVDLRPGAVLLAGTDGFGDPLGDGDGQIGQLFAGELRVPPPPRAFAHLLDFSRETFDDDRTLLAIWPHPLPETPR